MEIEHSVPVELECWKRFQVKLAVQSVIMRKTKVGVETLFIRVRIFAPVSLEVTLCLSFQVTFSTGVDRFALYPSVAHLAL